jgi:hypothetical protein
MYECYELPLTPSLIKEGEATQPRGHSIRVVKERILSFQGFGGVPQN